MPYMPSIQLCVSCMQDVFNGLLGLLCWVEGVERVGVGFGVGIDVEGVGLGQGDELKKK